MRTVKVTFLDNVEVEHTLSYKVYGSTLAKRWLRILRENQLYRDKYIHTSLYNKSGNDIDEVYKELIEVIQKINVEYDTPLPIFNMLEMDYSKLNLLHSMFEQWGGSVSDSETLVSNFLRLNELIHQYEQVLRNITQEFPSMSAIVDYYPQTLFADITSLDLLNVTNQYDWGQIYLGYNTLGKDWASVAGDNDTDVVVRGTVRPQKRFAAETWFSFNEKLSPMARSIGFEKWYRSLPPELQLKVPIDNLSSMVMGKFILGEVIIDDYFLKFDSNFNNWKVTNGETKKRWNLDVFSTFKKIKGIKIV